VTDENVRPDGSFEPGPAVRPATETLDAPLDFEGFYLFQQEFFHAFAEIHLGSRPAAEAAVHDVFVEILAHWDDLLLGDLERLTLSILHKHVAWRLQLAGHKPAFVLTGPMQQNLERVRKELELRPESVTGLYEAITCLPPRQFNVIVLRYLLGYETKRIARAMGLDPRTVDYHGRKAKERLRVKLGLPDE
jgi:RNA polymerase sigma-70 factor (ECF subfamily)